ncbi:SusC/RagA family TonB-linked outer membrane protein [Sphingobacterium bambusae]|uniref:SusC/RagA family TonB-linked outer membrane protein n=1 Tax=Sphingobacterium bambusae TaxID=662858 RepID=A0ABW6BMG0_9SPHI|nr:SusC/RagA family TonB-linked outer membrane protein [Sphingobacterium bambusae]WPL50907.1 SusC/RagA family TonB-linked outer membrane protein [Sphingobacterium bambusae]
MKITRKRYVGIRSFTNRRVRGSVRLIGLFYLLFIMGSVAIANAQRISLSISNTSLKQIMLAITQQTGFSFVYEDRDIMDIKPMTLHVSNRPLDAVLELLFRETDLECLIQNKAIIVRRTKAVQQTQQSFVSGKITDNDGKSLQGVSVQVKQRGIQVASGRDGAYRIMASPGDTLVFTNIGYVRQERILKTEATVNITLIAEMGLIEEVEVVSVGYGEQSRRLVTSSISSVKGTQIQNRPGATIESLLQGLAPGVLVQNNSGMPGGASNIQVRGLAAMSREANSNVISMPLFVIDGVPMEQDNFNPSDPTQQLTSILAGINPYDVESIDILKDAASTAIYGSRGANGVILIKTKRGNIGKPIVSLNTMYGTSYFPALRPTLGGNAERNAKIALWQEYINVRDFGGEQLPDMPIELTDSLNPFYNNSTDWQRQFIRNATFKDVNLGIRGGTENANYRVGATYYDEGGIILGSGFKRYGLSYYGQFIPVKKFNIVASANINQTDASRRRGGEFNQATIGNQFTSSLNPAPSDGLFQEYVDAFGRSVNTNLNRQIISRIEMAYDVLPFLNLSTRGSAIYSFGRQNIFNPSSINNDMRPSASYFSSEALTLMSESMIRYNQTFGGVHTFNVVVGNTINTNETNSILGSGTGGPSDNQQVIRGYPQANIRLGTDNFTYGLLSYYGRLVYDFKSKYVLNATWRADGSSKFGRDNRWGYFPSLSAAWLFSEESFVKKTMGDWLYLGKLRGSWGRVGQQYEDNYLAFGRYNTTGTYNGLPIVAPNYGGGNGIPLPNLGWESSTSYGVGLDLDLFNGRVTSTVDYYYRSNEDYLFEQPLSSTSGYRGIYINGGAIENTGVEFSATAYVFPMDKKFQYNITFMASRNNNKVLRLPDLGRSMQRSGGGSPAPYLMVGRPLNGFYLFEYLGVYPTDADVPVNPYTGTNVNPLFFGGRYRGGDIWLKDQNGDYQIDLRENSADLVYMGDPNPKLTGSLNQTFRWQMAGNSAIQLDALFVYSFGGKVYNRALANRMQDASWAGGGNVNYPFFQDNFPDLAGLDIWTPDNTNARYPTLNAWRSKLTSYDFVGNYAVPSSLFLEDGSFIRLRTLRFGYEFPQPFLDKFGGRRLTAYIAVDNLFHLSKYSGMDPENVDFFGIDQGNGYPLPRRFNFGLSFEL